MTEFFSLDYEDENGGSLHHKRGSTHGWADTSWRVFGGSTEDMTLFVNECLGVMTPGERRVADRFLAGSTATTWVQASTGGPGAARVALHRLRHKLDCNGFDVSRGMGGGTHHPEAGTDGESGREGPATGRGSTDQRHEPVR
jgi:hypothetical protein